MKEIMHNKPLFFSRSSMLFKLVLLTTFLTTSLFSAASSDDKVEFPFDGLELYNFLDPLEMAMAPNLNQDPYPVDPDYRWDLVFQKRKHPCLESDGCKKSFTSLAELIGHLKNSHNPYYNPPATCSTICNADGSRIAISYRTLWAYHYHLHQQAAEKNKATVTSPRKRKRSGTPADDDASDPDYNPTEAEHGPLMRRGPRQGSTPSKIRKLDPTKKIFKCDCGEKYNDPSSLRYHQDAEHSDIDYSCPYCQTPLAASSSLLQHLRNYHPEKKSTTELVCSIRGCTHKIYWPPMIAIHETLCRAKLEAELLNHEGE